MTLIENKVNYALLAYNNTVHSTTNLKPLEIISGHLENKDNFDLDLNNKIISNYIFNHKNKMKILYKAINEKSHANKEKVISKVNENREELPNIPSQVFVKNVQKQRKTKDKYKKETIKEIDRDKKVARIKTKHKNKHEKIHLSKIKRPRKQTYKFSNLSDSSQQEQQ